MAESHETKLRVRCACGARIAAAPEHRGRRLRCPRCGAAVAVPSDEQTASPRPAASDGLSAAPAPAASGRAAAPADRIKLHCACGASLAAPPGAAGRRVRCPKCAAAVSVPAAPAPAEGDDLLAGLAAGQALERPSPAAAGHAPAATPSRDGGELYFLAPEPERPEREVDPAPPPKGDPVRCPSCEKMHPPGTRICVACGVDLKTGRALVTTEDTNLDQVYMAAEAIIRAVSWVFWAGVYPVASEAFGLRRPWVVRGIAVVTTVVSIWYMIAFLYHPEPDPGLANLMLWSGDARTALLNDPDLREALADPNARELLGDANLDLGSYHPYQLITHMFLHADPLHLIGNMLFLMVLGTCVNALIGNILTLLLYPLLGVAAALAHLASLASDAPPQPMLGASGAIMGLAGVYLILMPTPHVHMAAWWRWGLMGGFQLNMNIFPVRGFWVVLFYIAFDVFYTAFRIEDNTAHWAHLGGFIAGAAVATALLIARLADARGGDLFTAVLGRFAWGLIGRPSSPRLALW